MLARQGFPAGEGDAGADQKAAELLRETKKRNEQGNHEQVSESDGSNVLLQCKAHTLLNGPLLHFLLYGRFFD